MTSRPEAARVSLCSRSDLVRLIRRLDGMPVTLMGLGLFGGGEGAARFLVSREAFVTVTDLKPADKLAPSLEHLRGLPINYRLGGHSVDDFTRTGLVVANPAVPRSNACLQAAQQAGVPITSPMNIFLCLCPAPVAAVTGSNGKSTTTALLSAMLQAAGRTAWMGGNIGISLLPSVDRISPDDVVVLELSSFQLEDAQALRWSPRVAVVTNVTPNHLDRHGTVEAYAEAKRTIVRFQEPGDCAVLNARSQMLRQWAEEGLAARLLTFDSGPRPDLTRAGVSLIEDALVWHEGASMETICRRDEVPLLGLHNVENVMAAAAAARFLGVSVSEIRRAVSGFSGLEHRLELVGEFEGVRYYNDSYSTTPAAGVAAVSSFSGPLGLIAGGYDKKLDLTPFAQAVARSVNVLVTFGNTGPMLAADVQRESQLIGRSVVIRGAAGLEEAILAVHGLSPRGSVVVFSPGCASYDMFENYRHRGQAFKELVRAKLGRPEVVRQGA